MYSENRSYIKQLGWIVSGNCDRPRSVLSGHAVKMHGKWPMSASYFALWRYDTPNHDHVI